jgi:peptidoglycan/LPS O-acetylase OafA/YrhL
MRCWQRYPAARHAVLLFFLLSGHLVTRSIVLNIRRNGEFDIAEYAASRIARIYPPLLGAIGICVIGWLLVHSLNLPGGLAYGLPGDLYRVRESFALHPGEIIAALTMQGGLLISDGPLWTLFIEFQIYMLAMFCATWWRPDLLSKVWTGIIALMAIMLLRYQVAFVVIWAMGAASEILVLKRRIVLPVAAVAVALAAALVLRTPAFLGPMMDTPPGLAIQILLCVPYSALLFSTMAERFRYPTALVATGGFSYSLYVIHFPLLLLGLSISQNWIGHSLVRTFAVAAACVLVVLPFTIFFAKVFEQQSLIKTKLLAGNWQIGDLKLLRPLNATPQQGRSPIPQPDGR